MLKVLPIQNKAEQEIACSRCGVVYQKELLAYAATVDDELVGVCQFRFGDKMAEIVDIASVPGVDDFEAMFIMGRATLNFIDLCGVHYAICHTTEENESLIRAIGLKKNENGVYDINLEGFFTDHCKHHKK